MTNIIEMDENYSEVLFETLIKTESREIQEEMCMYLKQRIKNGGREIFGLGEGAISCEQEYDIYRTILSARIEEEQYRRWFQHLAIPAGVMEESERINRVYVS